MADDDAPAKSMLQFGETDCEKVNMYIYTNGYIQLLYNNIYIYIYIRILKLYVIMVQLGINYFRYNRFMYS